MRRNNTKADELDNTLGKIPKNWREIIAATPTISPDDHISPHQIYAALSANREVGGINNWHHAETLRDALVSLKKHPRVGSLLEIEESLQNHKNNATKNPSSDFIKDGNLLSNSPIGLFLKCLDDGHYPPPEIMLLIADGFREYLEGDAGLDLEEVFFGPPIRRAGGYSQRHKNDLRFRDFELYCMVHGFSSPNRNQNKHGSSQKPILTDSTLKSKNMRAAAINFLNQFKGQKGHTFVDPESFLKSYRRWKKTKDK